MARVTLREPVPIADTPRAPAALAGLTAREREILAFLVPDAPTARSEDRYCDLGGAAALAERLAARGDG